MKLNAYERNTIEQALRYAKLYLMEEIQKAVKEKDGQLKASLEAQLLRFELFEEDIKEQ